MNTLPLALHLDDLNLEIKAALKCARAMGFAGTSIDATSGPISPESLGRSGQRHFLKHLSDLGIQLVGLRGPTTGPGYGDGLGGERRLDAMKNILTLAAALGVPTVSTTLGRCAGSEDDASRTGEALEILADAADRSGVSIAIETAGVASAELATELSRINCPSLAACCDTGALIMQGEDPHRIAEVLPGRVHLVRARDAIASTESSSGYEVAMGEGNLDPAALVGGLITMGYTGSLILTRSGGESPAEDLARARQAFVM